MPEPAQSSLYPISTVATLTGINPVTLRAWERRYGLLQPTRTESGHRLYSAADVARIKAILQLLDEGVAISRVGPALQQAPVAAASATTAETGLWHDYQQGMLHAVAQFNEAALEDLYNEAMSLYPVDVLTRQLLLPLLRLLGERWAGRPGGVAEEHFFSAFLRNKLGARFHHRNLQNQGPQLVAACLPGEQHEFGLLLFALAAHSRGYRLILLGANMPLEELPHVVQRTRSAAVVLSGSIAIVPEHVQQLRSLSQSLKVPVLLGGTSTRQQAETLADCGVTSMGDDLVIGLRVLARHLPAATQV